MASKRTSGQKFVVISQAWDSKIPKTETPSKSRAKPLGMNMFSPVRSAHPTPAQSAEAITHAAAASVEDEHLTKASQISTPFLIMPPRQMTRSHPSSSTQDQIHQLKQQLQQLKRDAEELVNKTQTSNSTKPGTSITDHTGATPQSATAHSLHNTADPDRSSRTPSPRTTTDTAPPPPPPSSALLPQDTNCTSSSISVSIAMAASSTALAALRQKQDQDRTAWLGVSTTIVDSNSPWPHSASSGGDGLGTSAEEKLRLEAAAKAPSKATLQSVYRLQQLQRLQQEGIAMVEQMSR